MESTTTAATATKDHPLGAADTNLTPARLDNRGLDLRHAP
jgi:hypothetical protein